MSKKINQREIYILGLNIKYTHSNSTIKIKRNSAIYIFYSKKKDVLTRVVSNLTCFAAIKIKIIIKQKYCFRHVKLT